MWLCYNVRMNLKMVLKLILVGIILGGCVKEEIIPEDISQQVSLDFTQHEFVIAGMPSYVKEENVYRVNSEEEVALLAYIHSLDDTLEFNYISDEELDINRIYSFLETLLAFSFNLSSSQLSYTQNDEVVLTLYQLHVEPVFAEWSLVDGYALDLVEDANLDKDTLLEKLEWTHDVIVLNTVYDESVLQLDLTKPTTHLSFDSLGFFLEQSAVCSGYSRAFNALSYALDIPSIIVSSENMMHAWNLVFDGDEWLFIDTTWDDPIPDKEGRVLYTYFLLDEKEFLSDGKHQFDQSSQTTLSADEYIAFANYVYFNE